jgi:hypothetical protein
MTKSVVTLCAVLALATVNAVGQSLSYSSGQNIAPGYEGWEVDPDGSKYFLFGYMNRNWEEEVDVPVGPANNLSPGDADQGQPTHFLPRRNIFVFRVKVPAQFSAKDEMVWTLTSKGTTEKAFASLREDYKVDGVVRASETGALGAGASSPEVRANKAPTVAVEGSRTLTGSVGKPLTIVATVVDDGVPKKRAAGLSGAAAGNVRQSAEGAAPATPTTPTAGRNFATLPPARATVGKNVGLHLSWITYRSPEGALVTFDPFQIKAWQDTRAGANSPWAPIWTAPPLPPDGKITVHATFSQPGSYVLRAVADDGALTSFDDVKVEVDK